MAIYMKIDGIDGSVTAKGFEKQIELHSFQFGVGRAISMDSGNAANRAHGRPSLSEITVTKNMENSSFGLLKEVLSGNAGKKVKISVVEVAADQLKEYVVYELEDVLISAYSVSTGGGVPSESISLSYAKITASFTSADKSNKAGAQMRVSYDLATAKAS